MVNYRGIKKKSKSIEIVPIYEEEDSNPCPWEAARCRRGGGGWEERRDWAARASRRDWDIFHSRKEKDCCSKSHHWVGN